MKTTLLRAGALACALMTTTALTAPALAQTAELPLFNQVDANGVDLVTGDFFFSMTEGTIGSGDGELSLVRNWAGPAQWTDNWSGTLYTNSIGAIVVKFGTYSDTFTYSSSAYSPTKANGATLVTISGGYRYTTADGVQIDYLSGSARGWALRGDTCLGSPNLTCSIPVSVRRPNGMTYTLNWDVEEVCDQYDMNLDCISNPRGFVRFRGASNSANYAFTIGYAASGSDPGGPGNDWFRRTGATFTNLDGAPGTLPTVSYANPSSSVFEVTDIGGQTWRFTYGTGVRLSGIRRPGASSDTTTITYESGGNKVASVVRDGLTTGYSRNLGPTVVTQIDGDSGTTDPQTVVEADATVDRIASVTDPLNHTTSYTYDSNGRLTRVTQPEGNYVQYTYDARGNVTETRAVAKSGSGLADIVTTASYDSTCANVVTCNQPNSVADARGNTTDFTYNSTHGGVLTVTAPAPSGSGDRPQTRYSYTQVTAVTGQPVYMPTGVSACANGTASGSPSCVGTANESRTVTAYDTDNLRVTSVTARNGDNSISATSAFTYDQVGNLLTVDGPLSGTADTTRIRYDSARRAIGTIGPDPDGGGSLHHRAQRTTYTHGLPTKQETGTVNSQSDSDWAAFTASEEVQQAYDANARPTVSRLVSGSTTYALTQTSYDGLGRAQCTAQRMNPSEFAASSLPSSACTLDTQGSYGPDRITQTVYDAVGRPSTTATALGTSAENWSYVLRSANGLVQYLVDVANGANNTTAFQLDGHDRLFATYYPNATGGGVNWSDYEQLNYLTASVGGSSRSTPLVASRTVRGGGSLAYSYDALGRLTGIDRPSASGIYDELRDSFYTYDLLGRMTSATHAASGLSSRPAWNLAFSHDALGRLVSQTDPMGTAGYAYDAAGRRTSLTYPGSGLVVGYTYDAASNLTEIRENPAGSNTLLATYAYDDRGRRTSLTRGNGTVTSYGYDAVSRLSQLVQNLNGTANDLTLDFSHSPGSQIVSNTRSNNGYSFTGHANANVSSSVNGLNQLTAVGGSGITHDARGNLDYDGARSFGYLTDNLLVSAYPHTLLYDPVGRLIHMDVPGGVIERYGYDGQSLIAEYDVYGAVTRRYVHGPGIDEPLVWYEGSGTSTRRYFHADERGSVVAVSDASGNLVGSTPNRYDEYGVPQGTLTGRFGYTGQMWLPDAGLYYYRARMYNPRLRFMQTDPIGYAGGMNIYAYVGNDPVNLVDPTGLDSEDCDPGLLFDNDPRDNADCQNVFVTGPRWRPAQFYDDYGNGPGSGGGQETEPGHRSFFRDDIGPNDCSLTNAEVADVARRFALVGQDPNNPIRHGAIYIADAGYGIDRLFGWGYWTSGPVRAAVSPNGLRTEVCTEPGHRLYGCVSRTWFRGPNGQGVFVDTLGYGQGHVSRAWHGANQFFGPQMFRSVNRRAASYVSRRYCRGSR